MSGGWGCCRHCVHTDQRHHYHPCIDCQIPGAADAAALLPAAVPLSAPDRRDDTTPEASRPTRRDRHDSLGGDAGPGGEGGGE